MLEKYQRMLESLKNSNNKHVRYAFMCKSNELLEKIEQYEKSIQNPRKVSV